MTLYSCSHQGKRPRTTYLAADAVVGIGLAGLADWAGHAQLPLQLVAGVAEARVQQRAPSIRPAVGLARAACDFVRAVALGGHLVVGPAGPARHALPVRVLVCEEGSLQGRLESEPVSSTDRDRGTRVRG